MNLYQKLNKKDEAAYHMYGGMKFRICEADELSKYRYSSYYNSYYITVYRQAGSPAIIKKRYKYFEKLKDKKWDYGLMFNIEVYNQKFSSKSIHNAIKLAYHYKRKVESLNDSFTRIKKTFIWKPTHVE